MKKNKHAVALGRRGGLATMRKRKSEERVRISSLGGKVGGKARAAALSPEKRKAIAKKAAAARWAKKAAAGKA